MQVLSVQDNRRQLPVSAEFSRIEALEQRYWRDDDPRYVAYAQHLTGLVRCPGGTMQLNVPQAVALHDIAVNRGAFVPIETGGGKTLISLLAPLMVGARRPILLTLSNLIDDKTKPELIEYARHFAVPNYIRMVGYEALGVKSGATLLEQYQPDMIIADEAHMLKNLDAGRTARVARYMQANPWCVYVDLSGTFMNRSLQDFAHRLLWALGPSRTPLPTTAWDLDQWDELIGLKKLKRRRGQDRDEPYAVPDERSKHIAPGAMLRFAQQRDYVDLVEDEDGNMRTPTEYDVARRALGNRIRVTPGVVTTSGEAPVGASLQFRKLYLHPPQVVQDAIDTLCTLNETPDGYTFDEASREWAFMRSLGLGFYRRGNPWPPKPWLQARRLYTCAIRSILRDTKRELDTAAQAVEAVEKHGWYVDKRIETARGEVCTVRDAFYLWRLMRDTYEYKTVPEWLSTHALDACIAWGAEHPGIIWTEDVEFAEELARRSRLPYYGAEGRDALTGRTVMSEDGKRSIICSRPAVSNGFNLQKAFARALFTNFYPVGLYAQQSISRIHRPYQPADVVHVDFLIGSQANEEAIRQAMRDAQGIQQMTRERQKVLIGDWVHSKTLAA